MKTFRQFIDDLLALDLPSVQQILTSPPALINTDDLPIAYPRLPGGAVEITSFSGSTIATIGVELVIVIDPIKTGLHDVNFDMSVSVIDELNIALEQAVQTADVDGWTIKTDVDIVGDLKTLYWLVIAQITASG